MAAILKIDDQYASGGQPNEGDIKELKAKGFQSVINLRTNEETQANPAVSPAKEQQSIESLGMEYIHLPVHASDPNLMLIGDFIKAVEQLPKPVFGHCKSGARAALFYLAYLARMNRWNFSQTLQYGSNHGIELNLTYRKLLEDYLECKSVDV